MIACSPLQAFYFFREKESYFFYYFLFLKNRISLLLGNTNCMSVYLNIALELIYLDTKKHETVISGPDL